MTAAKKIRYASVCDGIGAVHAAWNPLGWECAWTSEIEPFPIAVVEHHWKLPNLGDMNAITEDQLEKHGPIDLLVGGTPCQSFSIAGLRGGLADARGNLALVFLKLVDRTRPRYVVWENVPGVHSSWTDEETFTPSKKSRATIEAARRIAEQAGFDLGADFGADQFEEANQSNDFDCFIAGLEMLGYGVATRIFDAQYFGVPQRRERVFVVGCLGSWQRACAILLDRNSLSGNPAPRRQAGEKVADTISSRPTGGGGLGTDFDLDGGIIETGGGISRCLNAGGMGRQDFETETLIPVTGGFFDAPTHALRGEGFDASEDGTGRGTPLVPVAFDTTQITSKTNRSNPQPGDPCHPITANGDAPLIAFGAQNSVSQGDGVSEEVFATLDKSKIPAVAFAIQERAVSENITQGPGGKGFQEECAYTLEARNRVQMVARSGVRRLTPEECESLQGFSRGYTAIKFRGKPAADGPRYKSLGNSMARPVIEWLGRRIELVDSMIAGAK